MGTVMTHQDHLQGALAYMDAVRERLDAIASQQLEAIGQGRHRHHGDA